jgi:DNA (cytosine-5)-methyltransferase 1
VIVDAVDLFAGGGGLTEAARLAGVRVRWAANHSPLAVRFHAANHPETAHACQDLQQYDFRQVPRHGLLLAAPSCRGHTQCASSVGEGNRGRAPYHDADRATAFAVLTCAEVHRPELVIVENVTQLRGWVFWRAWCAAWEDLGYHRHELVLDAADFGVPQNRRRLFVVLARRLLPELAAALDPWRAPAPPASSFVDVDGGSGWGLVRDKPTGVQVRVAKGRRRIPRGPFLTQHVTGHPGRSLSRPIGTITTKHQWAIVRPSRRGDEVRMLNGREHALGCGFRVDYQIPEETTHAVLLAGNAVPPPLGRAVIAATLKVAELAPMLRA